MSAKSGINEYMSDKECHICAALIVTLQPRFNRFCMSLVDIACMCMYRTYSIEKGLSPEQLAKDHKAKTNTEYDNDIAWKNSFYSLFSNS